MKYTVIFFFIMFSLCFAVNPLEENLNYRPSGITHIRIIKEIAGSYNNPGSAVIAFHVEDKGHSALYWYGKNNFLFYVGNKRVKNYFLSSSYSHYTVHIPRLPYQKKNGYYSFTIKIKNQNGILLTKKISRYIHYTSPKINLILIVDTSVSMRLNDPDNDRRKAIRNILRYAERNNAIDKISIIKFSSEAHTLCPLTSIRNKSVILKAVEEIDALGETNMGDGLDKAFEQIKTAEGREKNIVILLTDGENNAPYHNNHLKFKKIGVPVYTIGLTKHVDNQFLNTIAETTGGEYYKIPDSFRIQKVYSDIIHKEINQKIFIDKSFLMKPNSITNIVFTADRSIKKLNVFSYWNYPTVYITTKSRKKQYNISKFSNFQFFYLRSLKKKKYVFQIKNKSSKTNFVSLSCFINSSLNIEPRLPKTSFYLKEPVELSLLAFQDDEPLRHLHVSVRITSRQTNTQLFLYDKGCYNDGKSGDGLYRNYFVPQKSGSYTVSYTVRGRTLDSQDFVRYKVRHFTVSDKENTLLQIFPVQVDMSPVGRGIQYYKNFQLISDYTNRQSIKVSYIGKNLQVHIKPDLFLLDKNKKKLFNLSVFFNKKQQTGIYKGQLILQINKDFFLEPFRVNFYKYHIPENDEYVR